MQVVHISRRAEATSHEITVVSICMYVAICHPCVCHARTCAMHTNIMLLSNQDEDRKWQPL